MADPITITLQGGTLLLIGERLFAYLITPRLRTKGETEERKSLITSGDQDPAFWQREFREAIDEKLDQRVIPILEKQTAILETQARTMEGVSATVRDLADIMKRRRR